MYRLPAGSGGTIALFMRDPTPTLMSGELSYTETRQVTGVVPSGNSSGNSAARRRKKLLRKCQTCDSHGKAKSGRNRCIIQFMIKQSEYTPSLSWQQFVYCVGIGKAKDKPYQHVYHVSTAKK